MNSEFQHLPDSAREIKKGGGTRRFFRAEFKGVPAVFCFYDDAKEENRYYAGIAALLRSIGVPAPRILTASAEEKLLVMEDLGAVDLWTLRRENSPETATAYRSALRGLACLHARGLDALATAGTPIMRDGFNRDYYRWEREYFLQNAVLEGAKIRLSSRERAALDEELSHLADALLSFPPQLVHRDCQSQNILWKNGVAHFIDFQGMRVGTGWYDVASLLFDPYVEIAPRERRELWAFYCGEVGVPADEVAERRFLFAAAQRLMQALGAYFFLSQKMGKPHFRAHVLPALENLLVASSATGTLPRLCALAKNLLFAEKNFSRER